MQNKIVINRIRNKIYVIFSSTAKCPGRHKKARFLK